MKKAKKAKVPAKKRALKIAGKLTLFGFITFLVMFVLIVLAASVRMAIDASFWKQLKDNVE